MEGGGDSSVFAVMCMRTGRLRVGCVIRSAMTFSAGSRCSSRASAKGTPDWLRALDEALHRSPILIALCSRLSVHRPWVNFELSGLDAPEAHHPSVPRRAGSG